MSELIDRQAAIVEIAKQEKIVPYYFHGEKPSETYFNAGLHAAMGIIQSQPPASPWHRVEEPPKEEGKMSNVVTELLARIGEASALKALMGTEVLTGETDIPVVSVRQHCMDDSMDVSYEIEGEPRRLVYVPGFDWMWYNAEGPES